MLLKRYNEVWLQVALALLSNPVTIESSWFSSEEIRFVLKVVLFQVVKESWSHMGMI